jgi:hypothetical protein
VVEVPVRTDNRIHRVRRQLHPPHVGDHAVRADAGVEQPAPPRRTRIGHEQVDGVVHERGEVQPADGGRGIRSPVDAPTSAGTTTAGEM